MATCHHPGLIKGYARPTKSDASRTNTIQQWSRAAMMVKITAAPVVWKTEILFGSQSSCRTRPALLRPAVGIAASWGITLKTTTNADSQYNPMGPRHSAVEVSVLTISLPRASKDKPI